MTWTYQPVVGCGENRKSGFEREDWGATLSSTPTTDGENWKNNQGWDVRSENPPSADDVNGWRGVKVVDFRVTEIELNDNDLSGTLPSELGDLSNLQILQLYVNSLSGTLPSELGDLSNLLWLGLNSNSLSGTIPNSIEDLSANKRLENPPYVETQITNLTVNSGENFNLDVSTYFGDINNNISSYGANGLPNGLTIDSSSGAIGGTPTTGGTFPVTVTVSDTEESYVSDEFNIDVRPILDANDYAALKALYTRTSGENWKNNTSWNFSSTTPPIADVVDKWHGVTVVGLRVTEIELNDNDLSGTLPSELGDLSNLFELYLNDNDLSGTLPSELGDLSNLQYLYLYDNSLSGTIPNSINALSADKRLENPPYVETQITNLTVNSGENFNLDVSTYFGDINNNISSYGANGLPNGLTIDSSSGAIGGTPTTGGTFPVTVTVSDTEGGDVSDEFNIDVRPNRNAISDELDIDVRLDADDYAAEGSRVTAIDLNNNSLSGMLPSELGDLSNLQNLSLHDNDNITSYSAEDLPNGLTVDSINFDIDGNGETDALTDGIVVMRYLFQFSGDALINGVIGVGATRTTALEITNYLDMARETMLDADGNGMADALTDGITIMRYLFGFGGNTVIDEALGPDTTRTTAAAIIDHLQSFDIGF